MGDESGAGVVIRHTSATELAHNRIGSNAGAGVFADSFSRSSLSHNVLEAEGAEGLDRMLRSSKALRALTMRNFDIDDGTGALARARHEVRRRVVAQRGHQRARWKEV